MNISNYFEQTEELFEGLDVRNLEIIQAVMKNAADHIRETFEADLPGTLENSTYPRFGYTTTQEINNEDEYEQHLRTDFEEQLAGWLETAPEYVEELSLSAKIESIKSMFNTDDKGTYIVTSEATSSWIDDSYTIRVDRCSTLHDDDAFDFVYPDSEADENSEEQEIIVWKYSDEADVEFFHNEDKATDRMIDCAYTMLFEDHS